MSDVRVLIVDDHPIFRMGMAAAIAEMDGVELVGEAERAGDVESLVAESEPDVVLLDVSLPDGSGLEVNRRLAAAHPDVRVVVLTMSEDSDTVLSALRDGALGYLVKGAGPERVEQALRTVMGGEVVLDHDLTRAVTELAGLRRSAAAPRAFPELTDREFAVLELLAEGLDNHSIARRLFLSPKTVRNHVSNVLTKLHAGDRAQAIVLARRAGVAADAPPSGEVQ